MKLSTVRNELIKQTAIVLVAISILGGILWYIISLNDESYTEITNLNNQVSTISRQTSDLSTEYGKVNNVMDDYLMVKDKIEKKMLDIDKNALRDVIAEVKGERNLDISEVKINEVKELSGDKYKRESTYIESGNISITAKSSSDVDILHLMKTLEIKFSGIKFNSLSFITKKEINDSTLSEIRSSGFSPIVESKINFNIFGLRNAKVIDDELTTSK